MLDSLWHCCLCRSPHHLLSVACTTDHKCSQSHHNSQICPCFDCCDTYVSAALVSQDGWTALTVAAENGHEGVVQLLLDHRSDVNIRDRVCALPSMWPAVHLVHCLWQLLNERSVCLFYLTLNSMGRIDQYA